MPSHPVALASGRRRRLGAALATGLWLATSLSAQPLLAPRQTQAVAATPKPAAPPDYGEDESDDPLARLPPGERAARKACTICHVYVEPTMLTRTNWAEQILPRMMCELGVAQPDYSSSPEGELIRARGIYPDKPRIAVEDWPLIEEFYLSRAPEAPLPQAPRAEIGLGLKHFRAEMPAYRQSPPTTTLVRISTPNRRIYVGDEKAQSIAVLDAQGRLRDTVPVGNVPVDLVEKDGGLYVTCIGSFVPSEYYRASFLFVPEQGGRFGERKVLLKDLPRATQARFADLNGDGRDDFALCMFGNRTGRFSWFENQGGDVYREHVLSTKAGAMVVQVADFNRDRKPDLMVLMAQELEMPVLMINDGQGNFSSDSVYQRPPVWGHAYFELADFNADGHPDIVVVNGDNGEYDSPLKNYHGVRILVNDGNNQFSEAFFYPLNGAYAAMARDFDQDGDLDLACISYFPDYLNAPRESFVLLENQGGFRFTATTFSQCIAGRWLVMDAGDIDGDGDVDIVLGSHARGPGGTPQVLYNIWSDRGGSVLILRNTLSQSRAASPAPERPPEP